MATVPTDDNRTKVRICGEELVLRGPESEEYLQQLGSLVHSRMDHLRGLHPNLARHRVAILTAIYFADELTKLQKVYTELVQVLNEAR
jgi:cell division protein ZapA (FtsZ GTPase activity inhibitor)